MFNSCPNKSVGVWFQKFVRTVFYFDVALEETLKKLPNDILKYYTDVIHDRDAKKEKQDSKDRRIDCLEEELKEVKDELFKFKCQMKYEVSGWEDFCKFIKVD